MKRFGIIVLSVLLLYAGVAEALDACFAHDTHAHHEAGEAHQGQGFPNTRIQAGDDCLPLTLCSFLAEEVGAPAIAPCAASYRPNEAASSLLFDSISPSSRGPPGPFASNRLIAGSFNAGVPRHLFLSLFHI